MRPSRPRLAFLISLPVRDVAAVVEAAERHGGRVENRPEREGERIHAAVRDPDGNTLEIHGTR